MLLTIGYAWLAVRFIEAKDQLRKELTIREILEARQETLADQVNDLEEHLAKVRDGGGPEPQDDESLGHTVH